jgi:hypothetical protein
MNPDHNGKTAAMAALAVALLKDHPVRDTVVTRWREYLPHALAAFGPDAYEELAVQSALNFVQFVEVALDAPAALRVP